MTKHTSWLFAAALLVGSAAVAQDKAPAKKPSGDSKQVKFTPPKVVKDEEVQVKEKVKFTPPTIVKDEEVQVKTVATPTPQAKKKAAPSAHSKPRVKLSDLKPETRAKVEKGEPLTEAEKAEVRKAAKPPLKAGEELPPPPPPAPPKVKELPAPPPPPPAPPRKN